MKKIFYCVIAVMLAAMVFVACSKSEAAASGTSAQAAAAPANAGELTYVTFWNQGEPSANYLALCVDAFQKETGVKVNFSPVGRDIMTKIRTDILSGNSPDLIDQDFVEINAALMKGDDKGLLPLDDLLKSSGPDGEATFMDVFNKSEMDLFARDGSYYYIPYVKVTSGFFYNKTLFEKLGLNPPRTWDDFMTVNQKLKANGIAPLALDGNISFYNAYYYYWACTRVLGSGKFSAAANDATGAAWDDPGFLQAAQMVYDLSKGGKNYFQDGYEGSAYPAAQSDWALGKSGSVLCGTWIPNETGQMVAQDWKYGFFAFPEVHGAKGSYTDVEGYLMGYAIPKGAKNPDNAKKFIKFALKKEWAQTFVKMTDNMSGRKDVDPPAVLSDVTAYLANATSAHKSYDGLMSDLPDWWANVFYPVDNDLIFGKITPKQFIDKIKTQTVAYWQGKVDLGANVR